MRDPRPPSYLLAGGQGNVGSVDGSAVGIGGSPEGRVHPPEVGAGLPVPPSGFEEVVVAGEVPVGAGPVPVGAAGVGTAGGVASVGVGVAGAVVSGAAVGAAPVGKGIVSSDSSSFLQAPMARAKPASTTTPAPIS
jgi:hypothetical protein